MSEHSGRTDNMASDYEPLASILARSGGFDALSPLGNQRHETDIDLVNTVSHIFNRVQCHAQSPVLV